MIVTWSSVRARAHKRPISDELQSSIKRIDGDLRTARGLTDYSQVGIKKERAAGHPCLTNTRVVLRESADPVETSRYITSNDTVWFGVTRPETSRENLLVRQYKCQPSVRGICITKSDHRLTVIMRSQASTAVAKTSCKLALTPPTVRLGRGLESRKRQ